MSPATTIDNNEDPQFTQILEELKSAPTAPGALRQIYSDGLE